MIAKRAALALGGLLVAGWALAGVWMDAPALAGANGSASPSPPGQNESGGDISYDNGDSQSGSSNSGDAVAGQVVGVVSAGEASIDATNRSEDVDVETGQASGTNEVSEPNVGQFDGNNEMQGDITFEVSQDASASSGDGVGGQVIGVVTSAGGSADVVAANTSEDADIETGDALADNLVSEPDVGQFDGANNEMQDGDITLEAGQAATAASGDGVGGQVLGIVSAGDASVDATNESTDVDVETGDAVADNSISEPDIGQFDGGNNEMQGGDIDYSVGQEASTNSGDAVAGQVAGVVTSAGGSADLVLANTSEDLDAESGFSEFINSVDEVFVGQEIEGPMAVLD